MPDTSNDNTVSAGSLQGPSGTIGPYRLIELLGAGGMGEVWRGVQDTPFHRTVAVKLIKAGMDTKAVVARFDSERQALALMEHPNIAKVYDAGSTPAGRPYFVMEYVPGVPITDYSDQHTLTLRERLHVFIQVCEGVQHAHHKAIIHRDLKPSNVLVTELDQKAVPKIIDFGLAKATGQRLTDMTMFTEVGAMVGTPAYMSPEQADGNEPNIDTRTDVYSLGVILYELLVGMLPFGSHELRADGAEAMRRKIRENEPVSPSAKIKSLGGSSSDFALKRREEPQTLQKRLRGELDWITLKALEKDRARRYGSPAELAADIQRYLNDEPVVAGPPSTMYRAGKFIRRHRFGVAVAASAVLLLFAFAATMAVQARRIAKERDRANHEAEVSKRVSEFMSQMFKVSDPGEARGNQVTAREILDKASNEIEQGLAKDVEVQSQLMEVMALTYLNLGLYSRAHTLAQSALENRRRALGPDHPKTLESMTQLGWILDREGRELEAEKITRDALALEQRVLGKEDVLTLETEDNLAIVLEKQGHYAEEEKLERDLVAARTRKLGPENPQTLRSRLNLADAVHGQGRLAESEKQFRELLEVERRVWGAGHPTLLATMHNLANVIQEEGRYDEAEALYRETLDTERRVLGPEHPDTASTMTTLANTIMYGQGRASGAEALYRQALEILQRNLGPEHPYTMQAEEGLANTLASEEHYQEAEKFHREILSIRLRVFGPDNADTLLSQYNLGDVLFREGHVAQADKLLRETLRAQSRVLGDENPDTLASKAFLARILVKEDKPREAEELARQALEVQLRILGPQHGDTLSTLQSLGTALVYDHRYDEAKSLFTDTIEKIDKTPNANSSLAWYNFACLAVTARRPDEAIGYLRHAVDLGYQDADHMEADVDLKALRGTPAFSALLSEARKQTAANPH